MTKARSLSDFIESDGSVTLVDNQKIKVGTGNDLEIYHDGTHSYVSDVGTGGLKLTGGDVYIRNPSDQDMIYASSGAAVKLFYSGSQKLSTTSSGIDVTGTSDLNGNVTIGTSITTLLTGNDIDFQRAGDSYLSQTGGGSLFIRTNDGSSNKVRLNLSPIGDISFYEDTGTTAKFFWDASAESLGIGTTSPTEKLHIDDTNAVIKLNAKTSGSGVSSVQFADQGTVKWSAGISKNSSQSGANFSIFEDGSSGNPRFTVKDGGLIGIGTSSPATYLHIKTTSPTISMTDTNSFSDTEDRFQIRANADVGVVQWFDNSTSSTANIMTFTPTSRVGVNESNPDRTLHVNSGTTNVVSTFESTDGTAAIELKDNGGTVELSTAGGSFAVQPQGGAANLTVDTNGFVTLNKEGNDYGLQLQSSGTRSGFVIAYPNEPTNIDGSALVLASDASFRLGTAQHYHHIMQQDGRTSIMGDDHETFRAGADRLWSMGAGDYTQGSVRVYVSQGTVNNGSTIDLFGNSSAYTDIGYWMVIEAFHSGRTYYSSIGHIGGYGWNATTTGSGYSFNNATVATGRQKLTWTNSSGHTASYNIAAYIWGDPSVDVYTGAISGLI